MDWNDFLDAQRDADRDLVAKGGNAPMLAGLMYQHPGINDGRSRWDDNGYKSYWGYKWDQDDKLRSLYGGYADATRRANELRLGKPYGYQDEQTKYWDKLAHGYSIDASKLNRQRYEAFARNPHPSKSAYEQEVQDPHGNAVRQMLQ